MITRYTHTKHYKAVASWYHARGLEAPIPEALPSLGYVVEGKIVGWVHRTDSDIAVIKTIMSNPKTLPSGRRQALETLVGVLLDSATNLGYTHVIVISDHPSTVKLASKYNLKESTQKLFILDESVVEDDNSDEWV